MPPIIVWTVRLRVIGILIAVIASVATIRGVWAAPIQVTWMNPVAYDDSSPLAASDIASTTVEYSSGTTFGTVAGQQVVTGSVTSATIDRPPGSWCFRAYTTVIAAKGGGRSVASNVACKAVPFPNPRPPSLLDVILAWLRSVWGRFA